MHFIARSVFLTAIGAASSVPKDSSVVSEEWATYTTYDANTLGTMTEISTTNKPISPSPRPEAACQATIDKLEIVISHKKKYIHLCSLGHHFGGVTVLSEHVRNS